MVEKYAETLLPTQHGEFRCVVFKADDGREHIAMSVGDIQGDDVLCRVHSECLTSEVLGSLKCDCNIQLERGLQRIQKEGRGVLLYLRQEGRGIGLGNKIRAYALQEKGHDTVDANRLLGLPDDARDYTVAAKMLEQLGVTSTVLMTNNPLKVEGLQKAGVPVTRRTPHLFEASDFAQGYLDTKAVRMGHKYEPDELAFKVVGK